MHHFLAIEIDLEHRRSEFLRAAEAEARAALARPQHGRIRWSHLPQLLLERLCLLSAPRLWLSDFRNSAANGRGVPKPTSAGKLMPLAKCSAPQ
jgi:hypothetical protein